ncbi:MAG: ParB N-terminal domain-containing protein [Thermodesulfovibrionia bacterium]|nr:ParB N-terminal domain-containing protein [Thermodesulfovibrionia bacterium]
MLDKKMTASCTYTGKPHYRQDGRGSYEVPIYEMKGHKFFLDCIDVNELERDEDAQPRTFNENQAKKIARSINRKILMQPILCRLDEKTNKILVTEGQHRWRACKDILKMEKIPCIVYINMDKQLALLCGIEANREDRAKALSGGDLARKVKDILLSTKDDLEDADPNTEINEIKVFEHLGIYSPGDIKKYLISRMIQQVIDHEQSLISKFISDRQSKDAPITSINLGFFLQQLIKTTPVEKSLSLREEEVENVNKITNLITSILIKPNWMHKPKTSEDKSKQEHVKNICKRHPFETLGYFAGKILMQAGGGDNSLGAAYCETDKIKWEAVEEKLKMLLDNKIWDDIKVSTERSIEKIKTQIIEAIDI